MNRKLKNIFLAGAIFLTSMPLISAADDPSYVKEKLKLAEQITKNIYLSLEKQEEDISASYLMGLDGEIDYILTTSEKGGYIIFEQENMEIIEFSEQGQSPYKNTDDKNSMYYAGPTNYFEQEDDFISHIPTGEKYKKQELKAIGKALKERLKEDRKNEKGGQFEQFDQIENQTKNRSIESEQVTEPAPGQTEQTLISADEYHVVNRKYIEKRGYFSSGLRHGDNDGGTCVTIAAQLLLSYHNWASDGRLITNENFLMPRTADILTKPYDSNMRSTTSTNVSTDGIVSFYEQLLIYAEEIASNNNGKTNLETAEGIIERYIDEYCPTLKNTITTTYLYDRNIAPITIRSEIDLNRPVQVAIEVYMPKKNADDKEIEGEYELGGHDVIVYGYQTFIMNNEPVDGFIAHYGWGDDTMDMWVNSSWVRGCLTFRSSHVHNDLEVKVDEEKQAHIIKCSECNRVNTNQNHNKTTTKILWERIENSTKSATDSYPNPDLHIAVCTCLYEEKVSHSFTAQFKDYKYHTITCECGYSYLAQHYQKNSIGYCHVCGGEMVG